MISLSKINYGNYGSLLGHNILAVDNYTIRKCIKEERRFDLVCGGKIFGGLFLQSVILRQNRDKSH